jgi:hypothetical protein
VHGRRADAHELAAKRLLQSVRDESVCGLISLRRRPPRNAGFAECLISSVDDLDVAQRVELVEIAAERVMWVFAKFAIEAHKKLGR